MTIEETNTALLKAAYDDWHATRGASVDQWMALLDDEFSMMSLAKGGDGMEFSADVICRDDLERYFRGLSEAMEMLYYRVDQYIAQGDTVVAMGETSWRVKATGATFTTPKVDVARFRDGRIVWWREFYDTAAILAATGGAATAADTA